MFVSSLTRHAGRLELFTASLVTRLSMSIAPSVRLRLVSIYVFMCVKPRRQKQKDARMRNLMATERVTSSFSARGQSASSNRETHKVESELRVLCRSLERRRDNSFLLLYGRIRFVSEGSTASASCSCLTSQQCRREDGSLDDPFSLSVEAFLSVCVLRTEKK